MKTVDIRDVQNALLTIHAENNLKGFDQAALAIFFVTQDEDLLKGVTKKLYPRVEEASGAPSGTMERNLRTLIARCWKRDCRRTLELMARREVEKKPTPLQLIEIVAVYLMRN